VIAFVADAEDAEEDGAEEDDAEEDDAEEDDEEDEADINISPFFYEDYRVILYLDDSQPYILRRGQDQMLNI
tara:strand:+ start:1125 stop:1340 length:216 start_codon:yes stop_codon:yes gene_type:complete